MKLLTIDVGGTEIKYAVIDDELNFYQKGYVPTPMDSMESFLSAIESIYLPVKEEVEGVAVSLPGFIDTKQGRVNGGGALKYNHGQPVGKFMEERLGCKVHLENDGKAAAMAELWKGSLKGCKDAAVFVIGTGVGGGLVIDGKIHKGRSFTAGEFSFLASDNEAAHDLDFTHMVGGNCSTSGLLALYRLYALSEEKLDGREFFKRYFEGDEAAAKALDTFARNVAVQIGNLGFLLNVEKVAIGGGISRQPILTEKIREAVDNLPAFKLIPPANEFMKPEVVTCQFANDANLIGAMYSYMIDD